MASLRLSRLMMSLETLPMNCNRISAALDAKFRRLLVK